MASGYGDVVKLRDYSRQSTYGGDKDAYSNISSYTRPSLRRLRRTVN